MSKRIAVLTPHKSENYGAILQAYALCKCLSILNKEVFPDIIDYECHAFTNPQKLFHIDKKQNCLTQIIKNILKLPIYFAYRNKKPFLTFTDRHLRLSDRKYTHDNLQESENDYDSFVVGSDQVWNYYASQMDDAYFLSFVTDNSKKYSYAASFGYTERYVQYKHDIIKLLSTFEGISLREPIGFEDIQAACKNVAVNVDPVFLLKPEQWSSVAVMPESKEKYILVYVATPQKYLHKHIKKLSKMTGLRVKQIIISHREIYRYILAGDDGYIGCSPEVFLGLFLNAEYIFTTSFHGAAFSILFKKNFFVEIESVRDALYNERIEHLLTLFNLRNRELGRNSDDMDYNKEIDWLAVESIIEVEKEKSICYLKKFTEAV